MLRKNPFYIMLSNAYEMESALIPLLENQAKEARNYPRISKYIKLLLKETKNKAKRTKNYMIKIERKDFDSASIA